MFKPKKLFNSKKLHVPPYVGIDYGSGESLIALATYGSSIMVMTSEGAKWIDPRSIRPEPFSSEHDIKIEWEMRPGGHTIMHQICMMTGQHRKIEVPREISRYTDARAISARDYNNIYAQRPMTATEVMQRQREMGWKPY